jgi:hypothetical protein
VLVPWQGGAPSPEWASSSCSGSCSSTLSGSGPPWPAPDRPPG